MSTVKQLAGSTQTLESSGSSTSNGAVGTASTTLDNTTELSFTYSFELNGGFGSSVTASSALDLYLVPKLDGTNAAASDTSTPVFQNSHYAGTFITPTTGTSTRRMTISGVAVDPVIYTAYISNRSGQTLSSGWGLKAFPVKSQSI